MIEMKIDKALLKKELNSSSYSFILKNIRLKDVLTIEDVHSIILSLIDLIDKKEYINQGDVVHVKSVDDIFILMCVDIYKKIDISDKEKQLLSLIVFITLHLTKITNESFNFLLMSIELVEEFSIYKNSIKKFSDSKDHRGLYVWLCKEIIGMEFYDETINLIDYEYAPPKITPQWLNKYRKAEEPMEFWFYNSMLGKSLFLILYTPKCRYAKCSGCNLPSLSSQDATTSPSAVFTQVDTVLRDLVSTAEKNAIKEVILSNNGNLFDIKTMPTLSLLYTINALIEELPQLQKIIIESRIEYLSEHQLKTINEVLSAHEGRNVQIEVALGFEIFDDELRNGYYQKGFYKSHLEKLMPLFGKYNVSLKFYMMYQSVPGMSTEDAIMDINNAAKYASELVNMHDVQINMHISPTYVAVGTLLEKEFNEGNYTPPGPKEISSLCDELSLFDNISYYISLNDEGLSSTHIEDEYKDFLNLKQRVDYFNSYQKWNDREVEFV